MRGERSRGIVGPEMSMRRLSAFKAVLLMLLVWVPVLGRTPANKSEGAAKKDYSEEAAVIEQYSLKIQFENDGSSRQEQYQRVRVQSEAGVQRYGLLTFSYDSGTGMFALEYVRVRKAGGSVVETGADGVQDMAAEITRQAPFYSDLREKHVAVKGLGIGDVLEFKTTARTVLGGLQFYEARRTTARDLGSERPARPSGEV